MSLLFTVIRVAIRTLFMRKQALLLENLALRQQLAAYRRTSERARQPGRCFRCHFDRWIFEAMGIKGIPIPYGAPNANAHVERFHRTLREAALDHFIFLSQGQVRRVCRECVEYHNRARPSQAIGRIPDPYPELQASPPMERKLVALPVLGRLEHDYRLVA
jgi:hypothetical protein